MKTFVINGNEFSTIDEFYDYIELTFTNPNFTMGRNLDALNDVLAGGFGAHEYLEPICIRWFNYKKSKKELGLIFVLDVIEIMLDCDRTGHNIKLELW